MTDLFETLPADRQTAILAEAACAEVLRALAEESVDAFVHRLKISRIWPTLGKMSPATLFGGALGVFAASLPGPFPPSKQPAKVVAAESVVARMRVGERPGLRVRIIDHIHKHPGLRAQEIQAALKIPDSRRDQLKAELAKLHAEGLVKTRGKTRGTRYFPSKKG